MSDDSDGEGSFRDDFTPFGRESEFRTLDVFKTIDRETMDSFDSGMKFTDIAIRIVKVIAYIITFSVVLGGAVVSKGTTLFMAAQISSSRNISYCNAGLERSSNVKQYAAQLPETERVVWMWCLFFSFIVPELLTFLRSLRKSLFKTFLIPHKLDILFAGSMETLHVLGVALLFFKVMPNLDSIRGAMLTSCVCFIPGILGMLSFDKTKNFSVPLLIADALAVVAQVTGFLIWPLLDSTYIDSVWFMPLSIFLISLGWWENYVSKDTRIFTFMYDVKKRLKRTRYSISLFMTIWKMAFFLFAMVGITYMNGQSVSDLFNLFHQGFAVHKFNVTEVRQSLLYETSYDYQRVIPTNRFVEMDSWDNTPLYVLLIQIGASYFCYIFGKFACRICIQGFGFALPLNLTMPLTIILLVVFCGLRNNDPCYFRDVIPSYLFFNFHETDFLNDFITVKHAWVWPLWLLSQTWLTVHIWFPKSDRLAKTEVLFLKPMYDSLLVDQSIALNRRRNEMPDLKTKDLEAENVEGFDEYINTIELSSEAAPVMRNDVRDSDNIPRIFACTTMWHETKDEMKALLKSILRMDEDQSTRRIAQKYLGVRDQQYYEYETNILFDDAFDKNEDGRDKGEYVVNEYVKDFVATLEEVAMQKYHNKRLRPPKKIPTPYGGRLVWTLPGKTKMICHLKNKAKIRHRKRWSQVMYMYYLLGQRLIKLPISVARKELIAEKTFLLALDGDIDFEPKAVELLIDLMKKDRVLGAACGRIHPVGTGPMAWYQIFEYATGHWLQKATEHVIGCVLCSPGCFSLFRAKALMDDNVMCKYTLTSNQARHYVQYDQGEDRWLCTLLLQRGYRVEYSAASDAYTHCPETFEEFFNQRRRWVPSTMANIFDLLGDAKNTVRSNDNISFIYIVYQSMLMVGSILGPGTIFLMMVGAFTAAFNIANWPSFKLNIIPIIIFMIICYTCKPNTQLAFAKVLSAIYALVMMAVLVGMMMQLQQDGWAAPSSMFLVMMAAVFFIAGLVHPQELYCLLHIVMYYITIPAMYMLLIIYSLFNMNNVTWGTREKAKTADEAEEERLFKEEQAKKKKKSIFNKIKSTKDSKYANTGGIECALGGLCKFIICPHPKSLAEETQIIRIADTQDTIGGRLATIEKALVNQPHSSSRRKSTVGISAVRDQYPLGVLHEDSEGEHSERSDESSLEVVHAEQKERSDLVNPFWIEDKDLTKGDVDYLSDDELEFWKDLIEKYLLPIDEDFKKQAQIAQELEDLRDRMAFGFFMMNALFVLIVFLLQMKKDLIYIRWPFGMETNVTFVPDSDEVVITKGYLQLEPIGMMFVIFFGIIIIIQFTCMLLHRFGTLSHILASTDLTPTTFDQIADKIVRDILSEKDPQEAEFKKNSSVMEDTQRRNTISNILTRTTNKTPVYKDNEALFRDKFFSDKFNGDKLAAIRKLSNRNIRRDTLQIIKNRRASYVTDRRQSMASSRDYSHRASTITNGSLSEVHSRSSSYVADPLGVRRLSSSNTRRNTVKFSD